MRILFLGDVVGRDARDVIVAKLPEIQKEHKIDATIINGENAVNGFGITAQVCNDFYKVGVDCITTGNHVWDQRSIVSHIDKDKRIIRPANQSINSPGRGHTVIETAKGYKVLVINLLGRVYMEPIMNDPFATVDNILNDYKLGGNVDAIFVDMHAEATSEATAMGYYCDGRVTAVIGTHTHVPTADARILPKGTAYQTDAGMCGVYDSIIGNDKEAAISRFLGKAPRERLKAASGEVTLCGNIIEVDKQTGLCKNINILSVGHRLSEEIIYA